MTTKPPAADPPQSEAASQASAASPSKPSSPASTVEVRVLLPADVVRRMDISRALVGQTRHAFISLAVERHLEHYGHMVLDLAPEGKSGVAVTLAGKDEPRHALPRRGRGDEAAGSPARPGGPADSPPAGPAAGAPGGGRGGQGGQGGREGGS